MLNFELKTSEHAKTIVLQGALTIRTTGALQSLLSQLFVDKKAVVWDMTKVTDLDLSGIQMIYVAYLNTLKYNQPFRIKAVPEEILKVIEESGYTSHFSQFIVSGKLSHTP